MIASLLRFGSAVMKLPTSGSVGQVLSWAASGVLAWLNIPIVIYAQRVNTTATGTGDQVLLTIPIDPNTLSTNRGLRIKAGMRHTTGSSSTFTGVKFGGTRLDANTGVVTLNWIEEVDLWGDGATNAQRYQVHTKSFTTGTVTHLCGRGAPAIDQTTSKDLVFYCNMATGSDVCTCDWVTVELIYK